MIIDAYRFGAPPPASTKWDSGAKGASIVLSSSDMVATGLAGSWQTVYGTIGKDSGKSQFEIVFLGGVSTDRPFASLADKTNIANLINTYAGDPGSTVIESMGYWGNGRFYWSLTAGSSWVGVSSTSTSDIVTVTVDLTLGTPEARFYLNGSLQRTQSLPSGKTWYPAASVQGGGSVQLKSSGLTHPQAGFADWG